VKPLQNANDELLLGIAAGRSILTALGGLLVGDQQAMPQSKGCTVQSLAKPSKKRQGAAAKP